MYNIFGSYAAGRSKSGPKNDEIVLLKISIMTGRIGVIILIYLDNAASSFPKAPQVGAQMQYYIENIGVNINRSVYAPAAQAGLQTLELREKLSEYFHHDDPDRVIFTAGNTAALNLAIKGFLHEGDHVLVSSMEHNAVMRPLVQLGVAFDRVPCDKEGHMDISAIEPLIRENTRLFVLCHASNVCGTIQDAKAVGELCKLYGIAFVLDAAQSAGHIEVDFEGFRLSALSVPAHKGLLGPQGIGALLISKAFAAQLDPLIAGGTGSMSDSEELPPHLPDRFESGTPNLPGIYGWSAAMDYVNQIGLAVRREREKELSAYFIAEIEKIDGVRLVGSHGIEDRVGVIAADYVNLDNAEAADILERDYGILTRCGLHCAPSAHKTLGTFPRGVVRFSIGHETGKEDIDAALHAIRATAKLGG